MMRVMKMLRICGWTARAAILMLCILVAAQSVSVHAEPPHDHADCDHAAAPQAHDDAGHDHAHDHDAQASAPHDHGSSTPSADPAAASHGSGCCGWFCSAATLPPAVSCKPLAAATMVAPLPLTGLHDGARLAGLFRPPRMPEHAA
jgi:hypothetical protein